MGIHQITAARMMRRCIALLLAFGSWRASAQVDSVVRDGRLSGWELQTRSGVYQIALTGQGEVVPVYYGPRAHAGWLSAQDRARGNGPFVLDEVPVRGKYADKVPVLEVVFADHTRDCELGFVSAAIEDVENRKTLHIIQRDKYYPLVVESFIRVLPEYDMMEKWIRVRNDGKKEVIKVENLQSGSILLPPDRYFLVQHSGRWADEFQLRKSELVSGVRTLQSRDFYSFENTPWFCITPQEGDDLKECNVWFGQVHYSGNWRIDIESTHSGHVQVAGGINFWDTQWELTAGESYTTPRMSIGFTEKGTDEAARLTSSYIRREILRPSTREKLRPVLYNSWYATGFNVNEENQLRLAKEAKELGVELFVIDDGWFKGRKDDHAGLGDWLADPEKFPAGLDPLIKKVNDMGMEFGIWVEPEMVNTNSDLFRAHPDWALYYPTRSRTEWRNQLTLNLAREDVYQYLLKAMTRLLGEHAIKFIKWDRNRGITEPGWASAPETVQREVRLLYIKNLYRLIDELRQRFPDVAFENCSSGGGRPDPGMLSRMDQTWTSDNTHPLDRLFIQYGYLSAYPANTMVCWTTDYDAGIINLPLEYIFDVAMQGVLGIGDNIARWTDAQKAVAKRKIAEYKDIRRVVQQGDLYRLRSPFGGQRVALQYVARDTSASVLFCYTMGPAPEGSTEETRRSRQLLLEGLDRAATYSVGKDSFSGAYLMTVGIPWPVGRPYRSVVIQIKKQ
ncbi:MAG: alpha-galactosidase [Bacteroidetes bacterium]|nr:alpha-galactosidase [Bacteroidota bacterium]